MTFMLTGSNDYEPTANSDMASSGLVTTIEYSGRVLDGACSVVFIGRH